MNNPRSQAIASELIGTAFLVATIVGSGMMGERLADGNRAIALMGNSLATGAMLVVLIQTFGAISGAHFNPAVTLIMALRNEMPLPEVCRYIGVQTLGALIGVVSANIMFELPPIMSSRHVRAGGSQLFSESIATFGLVLIILLAEKCRPAVVGYTVAAYITAGYWFTSSTAFANPAVTIARAFTDTFSGIRLADVPWFILAQCAGAAAAYPLFIWIWHRPVPNTKEIQVLARKEST